MLSVDDNELLTRVGPGTPMGSLMREYWVPAMLSSELPGPDCDPVRVLLLGEKLIAFRDSDGRIGLLDHLCPHRQASLFFGRNEERGLRCVYHGWKFDVEGRCMDMPSEPPRSDFRRKVRARSYPTTERNGLIWAYLGPRENPPPLPDLVPNMLDGGVLFAQMIEGNYLQVLEGDIDTTHASFLHYGALKAEDQPEGTFSEYQLRQRDARFEVIDTEGGVACAARRPGSPGHTYWRISQWCFPFYTFPPPGVLGIKQTSLCRVPMDDTHTMYFGMHVAAPGAGVQPSQQQLLPNTTDWYGRFRPIENLENDFLIDRDLQRSNHGNSGFTGIRVISAQDTAVQTSGGLIQDRSRERLGSTDAMIIRVRNRLLKAVNAYVNDGVTPPGVDEPAAYQVRSGGVELPEDADWVSSTVDLRQALTTVPGLDASVNGPL